MTARLLDPYTEVDPPIATNYCPADPSEENARVALVVPLPDTSRISLGNSGGGIRQPGIAMETQSHIRFSAGHEGTVLSLGGAPSGVSPPSPAVSGYMLWTSGHKREVVGGAVVENYDATQTMHVVLAATDNEKGHVKYDVTASGERRHTDGGLVETITEGRELKVTGASTEEYRGDQTTTVNDFHSMAVAGSTNRTIDGVYDLHATGGITITTPLVLTMTGTEGVKVTAPGGLDVTCASSRTELLGIIQKIGMSSQEFVGLKVGVTTLKNEAYMCISARNNAKIDMSASKIDLFLSKNDKTGTETTIKMSEVRAKAMETMKNAFTKWG